MAGLISQNIIEQVRNSSDIISIIGEYTKLERRSGNDWWGCCPFHGEKTASFHVDGDKKFYYCFGCHQSGDVIKFTMEMDKLSYVDAITVLAKKSGIQIRYENGHVPQKDDSLQKKINQYIDLYERTASMFHYILMETEQGKNALKYITERGLSKEILDKFKIGYAPADRLWLKKFLKSKNFSEDFLAESGLFSKNYKDISFFSDRLMFPICNRNGQVVAFGGRIIHPQGPNDRKYLNSGDLIQYKKRETLYAFNLAKNSIRTNKKIIFCEGYMDCIAYHMSDIDYAVAPLGTALTEEQIKMISGFVETVYLSFDSDNAGQNATIRAIYMCRQFDLPVKIIQLKGGKDPAEILLNFGKENLTAQVNSAILDSDYLLNRIGAMYPVDTPEGKIQAALEFFPYIDSLKSEIQKESSLDQLSQAFNLKPEAVRRDFLNRNQARDRIKIRSNNEKVEQNVPISLNAELRGLIAVTADLSQFEILRSSLSENDLKNPHAKQLFRILEDCYQKKTFSEIDILAACEGTGLAQLITQVISSDVYQKEKVTAVVQDTIKLIKKNKIEEQRDELLKRIRNFIVATEDDKILLDNMIKQKMELDKQVQSLIN